MAPAARAGKLARPLGLKKRTPVSVCRRSGYWLATRDFFAHARQSLRLSVNPKTLTHPQMSPVKRRKSRRTTPAAKLPASQGRPSNSPRWNLTNKADSGPLGCWLALLLLRVKREWRTYGKPGKPHLWQLHSSSGSDQYGKLLAALQDSAANPT